MKRIKIDRDEFADAIVQGMLQEQPEEWVVLYSEDGDLKVEHTAHLMHTTTRGWMPLVTIRELEGLCDGNNRYLGDEDFDMHEVAGWFVDEYYDEPAGYFEKKRGGTCSVAIVR